MPTKSNNTGGSRSYSCTVRKPEGLSLGDEVGKDKVRIKFKSGLEKEAEVG